MNRGPTAQPMTELLRESSGIDGELQQGEVSGRVESTSSRAFELMELSGWVTRYRVGGVVIDDMSPDGRLLAELGDRVRATYAVIQLANTTAYNRLQTLEVLQPHKGVRRERCRST